MLEPVDEVSVLVADEYVGAVMGDLSTRRGRVTGTEPVGSGRTLVKAEVPQMEITRYAVDLRSISHGTGTFSRALPAARADAAADRAAGAGRGRQLAGRHGQVAAIPRHQPVGRGREPGHRRHQHEPAEQCPSATVADQ